MEDYEINGAQHVPEKKYTGKMPGRSFPNGNAFSYVKKIHTKKIENIKSTPGLEYAVITRDTKTGKITIDKLKPIEYLKFPPIFPPIE